MRIALVLAAMSTVSCGVSPELAVAVAGDATDSAQLEARAPLRVPMRVTPAEQHQLILKFVDGVRARTAADGALSLTRSAARGAQSLSSARGVTFRPLFNLPLQTLTSIEQRAASNSRHAQPDFAGFMVAQVGPLSTEGLIELGRSFEALPEVEFAYLQPLFVEPPGDLAPTTPSYVSQQTYRGADIGVNVDAAWSRGAKGAGVQISDCEYGWVYAHEDLDGIDVTREPGQNPHPDVASFGYDEHGTAVLGETSGLENGYGITGIAPASKVRTFSEYTAESSYRRAEAIAAAVAASKSGDIVMLEMQTFGASGNYGPAEYDPSVFSIVKAGVEAGVVVIAAAGNGSEDLDSSAYAEYRSRGDSGAIIVGASTSDATRNRLSFSTYGRRVNVHAWGQNVVTVGYGDFATLGGDQKQQYTRFSGTSSATPIATSSAALLQSYALTRLGRTLKPLELRSLLSSTGKPQGTGVAGKIGTFPDVKAAIATLDTMSSNKPPAVAFTSPSAGAVLSGQASFTVAASDPDGSIEKVRFTLPGALGDVDAVAAPYAVSFDTKLIANGSYTLRATAYDNANATTTAELAFVVQNEVIVNQPPTVRFTSPTEGATVSGIFTIAATALDTDGTVTAVAFTLPNGTSSTMGSAPYALTFDSRAVPNGRYTLFATATDNVGATASATVSLTVDNQVATNCVNGTYTGPGVPSAIPDLSSGGVELPVTVSGNGTVASIKISANISHQNRGDLRVTLTSPSGFTYVLHNRAGAGSSDLVIADKSTNVFNGSAAGGVWRLKVSDLARQNVGQVNAWSVNIVGQCAP